MPAPVVRVLVVVVVVDFLCLTVLPAAGRGATTLEGDRVEDPTFVELGEAGCNS